MKKLLLVVLATTLLVSVPMISFSQSFSLLPGGFFGGQRTYGDGTVPRLEPLSFYVGWNESLGNALFSFDGQVGGAIGLTHRWPVRGLWLGVADRLNFSERCGLNVEAWWLIRSSAVGSENANFSRTVFIRVGDDLVPITLTGPQGETWNTFPDWWYIDGRLACSCGGRNFSWLAGFRYDHFSTSWQFAFDPFGGIPFSSSDRADITVNSYIPYVGFQYSCLGSTSNACLRLIGFPWVPATVQHLQSGEAGTGTRADSNGNFGRRGYFIEIFGEYSRTVFGGAGLGVWFRWQDLSGRGNLDTTISPGGLSGSDSFTFDRNTVAFGGKATLDFNLPF